MPGWVAMHEHLFYPGPTGMGRIPGVPEYYPTMVLFVSAALSRRGRDDDPHGRKHGALRGPRDEAVHRLGPHSRAEDAPHGSVSPGSPARICIQLHSLSSPEEAVEDGELLGRSRLHVVQGLHQHHARAARRRDSRRARAWPEGHWTSVLGDVPRSRGSRHRQPRARHQCQHRLRSRQGARPLPGADRFGEAIRTSARRRCRG